MMLATSYLALLLTQPPAPVPSAPPAEEIDRINSRHFDLPLKVDPARKDEIEEIHLFESWDKGKTWQRVAKVKPDQVRIEVKTKRDGLVWYTLRIIDTQGIADPADLSKSENIVKVRIETEQPPRPEKK